jgi:sn-glycerol 3-phosphate transport system ATP-binding protein
LNPDPSACCSLRIIAGLESATSGRVRIDGQDVTDLPPARRGIAMVFQNYALFPHLTVAENIGFGLSVRKVPAAEAHRRIDEAATLLGLDALLARRPGQLSGGQQQRVALGRALVAQARVCLMDEPLSNLDAQLRQEMRTELRELQRRLGLTVVYVTHDQAVLLSQGRVEQCAAPQDIYRRPATTFAARFIGTPAMNIARLDGLHIAGSHASAAPAGLQQPGPARWLGVRPEDLRLSLHGDGGREPVVAADIESLEYLGADLVLRCRVGSEQLMVRTAGSQLGGLQPGQLVGLRWAPEATHFFDEQGRRCAA